MKIIDLLNKIANGEIDKNNKYQFSKDDYCTINDFFTRYIVDEENLNLEIIEEKKIPERLYNYISCGWNGTCKDLKREELYKDLKQIGSKVNEIIDCLDYLKSKGEE